MRRGGLATAILLSAAALALAEQAETEEYVDGWAFGAPPHHDGEVHLGLWPTWPVGRNDVRWGASGGHLDLFDDVGVPEPLLVLHTDFQGYLGQAGWIGADAFGTMTESLTRTLDRPVIYDSVPLSPGDRIVSSFDFLLARLEYGYEFRHRSRPTTAGPVDLYAGPMLVYGVYTTRLDVHRLAPRLTPQLGGRMTGWILSPGIRAGVELLETVRFELEYESLTPWLELSFSTPEVEDWQRVHLQLQAHVGYFEVQVGYRFVLVRLHSHGREAALTLHGPDFLVGVRF